MSQPRWILTTISTKDESVTYRRNDVKKTHAVNDEQIYIKGLEYFEKKIDKEK